MAVKLVVSIDLAWPVPGFVLSTFDAIARALLGFLGTPVVQVEEETPTRLRVIVELPGQDTILPEVPRQVGEAIAEAIHRVGGLLGVTSLSVSVEGLPSPSPGSTFPPEPGPLPLPLPEPSPSPGPSPSPSPGPSPSPAPGPPAPQPAPVLGDQKELLVIVGLLALAIVLLK